MFYTNRFDWKKIVKVTIIKQVEWKLVIRKIAYIDNDSVINCYIAELYYIYLIL